MYSFRNAKWSWPITVIPVFIFLWIHYGTYQIIHESLAEKDSSQWLIYGIILSILWLVHTVFSTFLILSRSQLETKYGYATLWAYLPFVYLYLSNFYNMIPPTIPDWVVSENKRLYALIFIAPTLLHSLTIINVSKEPIRISPIKKLPVIIGSFVVSLVLLVTLPNVRPGIEHQITVLLFLLSSVSLLDGLIKLIDVNRLKTFLIKDQYIPIVKPLVAISFPLTGMLLNNDILFDAGFGNFSYISFYVWCLLNGVVTCAPDYKYKNYRAIIFLARSTTYAYIIWFIITLMPHLPLSAIAISSFGLGYLMVTPLVIIIFHTKLLVSDASYLYYHFPKRTIRTMFVSAISVPIVIDTFWTLSVS